MESFLKIDLKKIDFQNRLLTKIDFKKESIIWIIDRRGQIQSWPS
jgi:hypothetical protein